MLLSMTGFGRGEAVFEGCRIVTEVVGLNHRYLDVSVRLPNGLALIETELRRKIKARVGRGRVTVTVDVTPAAAGSPTVATTFDVELARRYAEQVREMAEFIGAKNDFSVIDIMGLPGVVSSAAETLDAERLAPAVAESLDIALDLFDEVRKREGATLRQDIEARVETISVMADQLERRVPTVVDAYRERLQNRVTELRDFGGVEPDRIAVEVALFADRCDVSEEIVRLRSHIERFRDVMNTDKSGGRLLDFLCQEMHREITTVGAKGRDAELSHLVVDAKGELEKVREQVQNIE